MNIVEIRKHIPTAVFTHELLESTLVDEVSNVNSKIAYMVNKGELIRLKKGLYALGEDYQTASIDTISLANILYAPSYVSFDYALSYYGLIPERVYEITSATLRGKKSFETELGRFTYRPVPLQAYALGVDWLFDKVNGGKLIAAPEKALCDKIRADRGIGRLTQEKLSVYLEYDLRIDMEMLLAFDEALVSKIAQAYRSGNLQNLGKIIGKRKRSA